MIPTAPDAERSVVGAMVLSASATAEAVEALREEDFTDLAYRRIFCACNDLWRRGVTPDQGLVIEHLRRTGHEDDATALVAAMVNVPTLNVGPHAEVVATYATRRRLWALAEQLQTAACDLAADVGETMDRARAELATAQIPSATTVADVVTMDEFCARPEPPATWAVPGLIDVEDRIVIVAPEGMGKTMLMRQLALAAGQGLHPFAPSERIPAVTTLLIDLENPGRIVRNKARPMLEMAKVWTGEHYEATRTWIWHRPGGINLRSRSGAAELAAVCAKVRPHLVCLGPLYKCYRADDAKSEHHAASEVAAVFDDLRTRHGFALVLEAHAPLRQGGVRDLRPFGSLLWQQWPEVGLKLIPEGEEGTPWFGQQLRVGTWRGSRDERPWPDELHRSSGGWPWEAKWNNGYQ